MEQQRPQQSATQHQEIQQKLPQAKSKGGKIVLIIIIIFLTLLVCAGVTAGGYLVWKNKTTSKKVDQETQDQDSDTGDEEDEEDEDVDTEDETGERESEFVVIDDEWTKYTNHELGFSMNIPNYMSHYLGSCEWVEEGGDHSYRPDPIDVPVSVFEDHDNNTIYISHEYFYRLGGETIESSTHYYSECNMINNTLALLKAGEATEISSWEIVFKTINNDTELEDFIVERYGEGCKLGDKTPTFQEGVYDVAIGGEFGLIDSPEICNVNYVTVIKYYPSENRLAVWNLGQACTFYADIANCHDNDMEESFEFE